MNKIKLLINSISLLIWSFSFAQQFTNYSTKDGLPSNHVYTILQDTTGFVWFLTDKGMVKYNGNQFKTFTTKQGLPNNDVWEARTTPDTKIWYFSKSAKLGYIENDSVYSFPNFNENEVMNPIFSSKIGNNVYPTGPNKTYNLIDKKWKLIYKNTKHNGSQDSTLVFHNKIKFISFSSNQDTIELIDHNNIIVKKYSIKLFSKNLGRRKQLNDSLYCFLSDKDFIIFNFNSLKLTHSTFKDEIGLDKVKHPRINIVNNKIQFSGTGFVGFLDENLQIKDPFFFPKEIKSHFALIDKSNTIWFATFSNGVYKLPYVKRSISYPLENQKTGKFSIINNQIFINVFNKGYYNYNLETNKFIEYLSVEDYPFKPSEIKELNTTFFPSKYKLTTIKDGNLKTIDSRKPNSKYNLKGYQFIYFKNDLYCLFAFGINKINPKNLFIEKEYLQSGCNNLLVFNNRLLICTNNGLKELKNDSIVPVHFNEKIFNKPILSINKISKTEILINTDGFGSYISNFKTITQLPQSNYLTVENAFVEKNHLWLASNEGVIKYQKNNKDFTFTKKINMNDGLPSNTINDVLIHKNKLFISTNNGIAILPKEQESVSQFLDIYVDNAYYNNKKINKGNSSFKYTSDNNTRFSVSRIDFNEDNTEISYQYKLSPVQKNWIKTTSKTINFTELAPNNYTLNLISNGIHKKFSFKILPLWYQQFISKLFFTIAIISLLLILLFKIRDRELAKKTNKINDQKKLAEYELHALRSQMNPHFVFNSLNAIQYYINKNEIELSEKYLVKFSRLIRKFFDYSRDKFITLEQEISLLNNYLEIEKMRFGDDFNYEFIVDEKLKLKGLKIPSMLLQPIVENSVNHGLFHNEGKGTITLIFSFNSEKKYSIEIIDNGIGLKKAKEIKEKSIKTHISKSSVIIKDRIHLLNKSHDWNVTYTIKELENTQGTIVKLTFKNNE